MLFAPAIFHPRRTALLLSLGLALLGCDRSPSQGDETQATTAAFDDSTAAGDEGAAPLLGAADESERRHADDGPSGEDYEEPPPQRQSSPATILPSTTRLDRPQIADDRELAAILGLIDVPPYYLDDLLTPEDISELLSTPSKPTPHPVPGLAPTPWHNGVRFVYNPERAGIIFEVRRYNSPMHAIQEFESLRRTNHGHTRRLEIGDEGFYSEEHRLTRVVTRHNASQTILSVSCDERLCHVPMVLQMLRRVISRLNDAYKPNESPPHTP